MNIDEFEALCSHRRSVRQFKPDPISRDLIERLLRVTQKAPSSYNLQPIHYYIVKQQLDKESIVRACLGQKQVLSAPIVVAFAADRRAEERNFERIWQEDVQLGAVTQEKFDICRHLVEMSFSTSPCGFGFLAKAILGPAIRLFSPLPRLPAVHKREWLEKNIGFPAMVFMLAAESAGLGTCPITTFDEGRVKKILKIPRAYDVPLLLAVGYPAERPPQRSRLPMDEVVHWR